MSKILIKCDMCGKFKDAQQTKMVESRNCVIFVNNPYVVDEDHFICHGCLNKLGWSEEKETETTLNEGEDKHE